MKIPKNKQRGLFMKKVLWIILGCTIASIGVLILRHSHVVTGEQLVCLLAYHMPFLCRLR